jgi:hypothetical protein
MYDIIVLLVCHSLDADLKLNYYTKSFIVNKDVLIQMPFPGKHETMFINTNISVP